MTMWLGRMLAHSAALAVRVQRQGVALVYHAGMTLLEHMARAQAALEAAGVALGQGTQTARDEAVWLVLWAAGLPLDVDLHDPAFSAAPANTQVPPATAARIEALIAARIHTRKPAAYLTQEAWLQGVSFYVDERSIIPRSLIAEVLADGSADAWIHPHNPRVLDLCTGNGSLAVLAALAWPDCTVLATDLSAAALEVATINRARHGLQARISLAQGDGLQPARAALAQQPGGFHLLLCNPPYVNSHSMAALPAEFLAEPQLALAGGADGMDFIRPLLRDAAEVLAPDGVLILEIGHERAHFERAFAHLHPLWLETSAGSDQVLLLTREMLLQPAPGSQK